MSHPAPAARHDQLRSLLLDYAPATHAEANYRAKMLELLGSPDAMSREHYAPGHFTASAFVLSPDYSQLLLIFHSKLKRWLQPGGHIDPTDPDVMNAARREVAEEVGLRELEPVGAGIFDLDVHLIPSRGDAPAHRHFDVRFAFVTQNTKHQAGSDAEAASWVSLERVMELESDESVWRAVRKLASNRRT